MHPRSPWRGIRLEVDVCQPIHSSKKNTLQGSNVTMLSRPSVHRKEYKKIKELKQEKIKNVEKQENILKNYDLPD